MTDDPIGYEVVPWSALTTGDRWVWPAEFPTERTLDPAGWHPPHPGSPLTGPT
jgi:hypothetical protein